MQKIITRSWQPVFLITGIVHSGGNLTKMRLNGRLIDLAGSQATAVNAISDYSVTDNLYVYLFLLFVNS